MDHHSIVEYLLSHSADPNAMNLAGLTPMHYAVENGDKSIVQVLAKHGADLNCECFQNLTPLLCAIVKDDGEMVKLLISLQADINFVSGGKAAPMMPLHFAASLCRFKMVKLLLENGADVNKVIPATGDTALHVAARAKPKKENLRHDVIALNCIVELLIKSGSDLKARQKSGLTPLQEALRAENISVAKALIINGSELNNSMDNVGGKFHTNFHMVCQTFDDDLIKLSLDYGADCYIVDYRGFYPIHLILLIAIDCTQCTITCFDQNTRTLTWSCNHQIRLESLFRRFWEKGFPFDKTFRIKGLINDRYKFPIMVGSLIQKQERYITGLMNLQLNVVQRAIREGASVRCVCTTLPYPLHFVAAVGHKGILKLLLSKGFPADTLNDVNETPLHAAAKAGHVDCCRLLLKFGASYNYSSRKKFKSPLAYAVENKHTEVVKLLRTVGNCFRVLKKGQLTQLVPNMKIFLAVMNCCDKKGFTLMSHAINLGQTDTAIWLMKLRLGLEMD